MPFVGPTATGASKTGSFAAGNYLNNCFQRKTANSWKNRKHSHGKDKATPVRFSYFLIMKLDLEDKTYLLSIFLTSCCQK